MITIIPIQTPSLYISALMTQVQVSSEGKQIMLSKLAYWLFYLTNVPVIAANIIKQEFLSKGAEAAVHRKSITHSVNGTDMVVGASQQALDYIISSLEKQAFGLSNIANKFRNVIQHVQQPYSLFTRRQQTLAYSQGPIIMGILNVTPDSFSDGGKFVSLLAANAQADALIAAGAQILDIGGESSRPGSDPITETEELQRVIPIIQSIRKRHKILISIDTTKSRVAAQALDAGADIVNDISALTADVLMLPLVVKRQSGVILMHMKGTPKMMQDHINYENVVVEVYQYLQEKIEMALNAGVLRNNLWVDPGIGFGKTMAHNLELLQKSSWFKGLGIPLVVGFSRKKFIGDILGKSVENRVFGDAAATAISVMNHVAILRVHDVNEIKQVALMAQAIAGSPS